MTENKEQPSKYNDPARNQDPVRNQDPARKHGPFDRALVRQRRGRAQRLSAVLKDGRFLYRRCAEDAAERVLDVSRNFERTLIIGDRDLAALVATRLGEKIGSIIYVDHTNCAADLDVICDEEALPFKAESFDLVINLLTLHGVNQVPQALARMKTLLRPDGFFMAAFFGGETLGALRHVIYAAEDEIYGRVSPRISSMIRLDQAASLLSASGMTMPVADRDVVSVRYSALTTLYADLRLMGETNILTDRMGVPVSRGFFKKIESIYKAQQGDAPEKYDGLGKYIVGFEIIWLTGWAPHPDQPKALKPGSAKMKLSDALGVAEEKL